MDLGRHLRYFLTVAHEGHFGQAAIELGIAQPALSQSIRRLETELGVTLFDRSRRRIQLTPAGHLLIHQARELLASETRLRQTMHRIGQGELHTLRAAVPPATPALALRELLQQMTHHAPGLDVDLCEMAGAPLIRALTDATVDTALLTAPFEGEGLIGTPVHRAEIGAILPRDHPLARTTTINLTDLAGHDLILPTRQTAPVWFERTLAVCREHHWTPPRVRQAHDTDFLLGLVLAGRGIALETATAATREPRLTWRPLTDAPLHRR
uniref:LysR family transcriptional regulator n=1 Tax=Nocardiopsis halotolerans TaxID=124252 RepID=UPI00035D2A70